MTLAEKLAWTRQRVAAITQELQQEEAWTATEAPVAVHPRFPVGAAVTTRIVPPTVRTIRPPVGAAGIVYKQEGGLVFVAFRLPLAEDDGGVWLVSPEKNYLGVGYFPDELEVAAAPVLTAEQMKFVTRGFS